MKKIKTVKLKITSHNKIFDSTIEIYNKALYFYIDVVEKEWSYVKLISQNEQIKYLESMTHRTKNNLNPLYDFDKDFYKYPSYLRRSTIMEAIGHVSSHHTRYDQWLKEKERAKENKKKFYKKPPTLQKEHNAFPVFYKTNMFNFLSENQCQIKIYKDNDWKWLILTYQSKNLKNRDLENYEQLNPSLVRKGKKYFLHIPYKTKVKLADQKKIPDVIISVDQGINKSAVCSAIRSDGTIQARLFIDQKREKDQLKHKLNNLSKAKRQSRITPKPNFWRRINGLQKFIVQDTANKIIDFAIEQGAKVIVFEYLGKMKVPKDFWGARKLRFKLQYWAKSKVQRIVQHKAHLNGMRFSRVLARGTSIYAYDGSGEVERIGNREIAKFSSGKIYHADLSASYNIGARYFIRIIVKPLSEKKVLPLKAKVPELVDRSRQTLASFIRLISVASPRLVKLG